MTDTQLSRLKSIPLGDNGVVVRNDGSPDANDIFSTDLTSGGRDTITGGTEDDIILGGAGGAVLPDLKEDEISGGAGNDIVLGDNGRMTRDVSNVVERIETTNPTSGGNDIIEGNSGADIILGGAADDVLYGNTEDDILLGDNGLVTLASGVIRRVESTNPLDGGVDTIESDAGEDLVFGGTGADTISGGADHDVLLGDHGLFDAALPANQRFLSIFTSHDDGGGIDTIHGDDGDDFILGQQGDDILYGDAGEDDITGGHNVIGGADGNDTMDGGADADVMLGDNGTIMRRLLPDGAWQRHPAPFPDVIRDVVRFDDIDRVAGNDTMSGEAGDDIMHGQRGDDTMYGGSGADEMFGELGNDTMSGDADHDIILGDVGVIQRLVDANGAPMLLPNGAWRRDILLTEVGELTGTLELDEDITLGEDFLSTEVALIVGRFNADGTRYHTLDGSWDTTILQLTLLADGADNLIGGDGDDLLFGQAGDDSLAGNAGNDYLEGDVGHDTLYGDDGADVLIGDSGINVAAFETAMPRVVHGLHLLAADSSVATAAGVQLGALGTIVVPSVSVILDVVPQRAPLFSVIPYLFSDLDLITAHNTLQGDHGTTVVPLASLIPDVMRHRHLFPGNDGLDGGTGDDLLVGDNSIVVAPDVAILPEQLDAVEDVIEILREATDDTLDLVDEDQGEDAPALILANDTLIGGEDNDMLVGDSAVVIAPFVVASAGVSEDALEDMAEQFDDVVEEFQEDAAHDLRHVAEALQGDDLELRVANDTLDGGAGNDVMVGDSHSIIASFIRVSSGADEVSDDLVDELLDELDELENVAEELQDAVHHEINKGEQKKSANDVMIGGAGNDLMFGQRGNDTLYGGDGNDELFGGSGKDTKEGGPGKDKVSGDDGDPEDHIRPWVRQFLLDLTLADNDEDADDELVVVISA